MTCCHSANPEKSLKDYFFTVLVDFRVPFWINFLSSSEFFSFRKGMEQDTMFSSVSVVHTLENFETRVRFSIVSQPQGQETIENQPRLKKFNLNLILTCNIYTGIEVLQIAVIFPDKGTYYLNMQVWRKLSNN